MVTLAECFGGVDAYIGDAVDPSERDVSFRPPFRRYFNLCVGFGD